MQSKHNNTPPRRRTAGTASPADPAADFSVVITGNEMAPTFPAGSTVYIQRRSSAAPGDAVLIMHNDRILCRRMLDDPFGNIYFVCDNPEHSDNVIMIRQDNIKNTVCFGTVSRVRLPDGEEKTAAEQPRY